MKAPEDDELIDSLRERGEEEDERAVGGDAVAVGAVEEVCVDPETHVRKPDGVYRA
jgi:hypothetical protein